MQDLVPVFPLLVCQLMQLLVKDVVPSPEGTVNVAALEVALLGDPPLLDREALQHVLPSQSVLGLQGGQDISVPGVVIEGGPVGAPPVEPGDQAYNESRVGLDVLQFGLQFGDAFLPGF